MIWTTSISDWAGIATIVGVILAIGATVYQVCRWWISKKHKKWLVLQDITSIQLIDENVARFKTINITYSGESNSSAYSKKLALLKGKILNVGDQDVLKEDFQSTLGINLVGVVKCLEIICSPSNQSSNAKLSLSPDGIKINVTFDILKPNDFIEFESLITISQYDLDRIFQSIDIQNGLKYTKVDKRQTSQPQGKTWGTANLLLTALLSLWICFSFGSVFIQSPKNMPAPKTVVFVSSNDEKYTATYQDRLVFVECVDNQSDTATKQSVYFMPEFEQKFRPEFLLDSPPAQEKQSCAYYVIRCTVLGLSFIVYICSAVVGIVAFMYLFWRLLTR